MRSGNNRAGRFQENGRENKKTCKKIEIDTVTRCKNNAKSTQKSIKKQSLCQSLGQTLDPAPKLQTLKAAKNSKKA